jgi:hypothetical protein
MFKIDEYPYRFADAVLKHSDEFKTSYKEIVAILQNADTPLLDPSKILKEGGVKQRGRKKRKGDDKKRFFLLPVDQISLNLNLDSEFKNYAWDIQPKVVPEELKWGPKTGLKADYKKGRLQVEVQFGNMARWYTV